MSSKTVFISYRRDAVGKAFARALKNALEHRGYDAFLDVDGFDAGQWADQILTEVPQRSHFLLLLTPRALEKCANPGDWLRREFELAQMSGRNIVPVQEESVDLAEMTKSCPESMSAVFGFQIAALRYGSYDSDVTVLTQRYIAAHQAPRAPQLSSVSATQPSAITVMLPDDPSTFDSKKKEGLRALLAKEAGVNPEEITILMIRKGSTKIEMQFSEGVANKIFKEFALGQGALRDRGITRIVAELRQGQSAKRISLRRLRTESWAFFGRESELALLDQIAHASKTRVVTIVAGGGVGKTTLVATWLSQLASRDWDAFEMVFDWSFYSQGTREQAAASSDLFLKEALTFFGDLALAESPQGAFEKGRRLAQLAGERRTLLILDGLEPLQYAPASPSAGQLKDQGVAALLKGLAAASQGLCLVTTRYSIPDLEAYWETTAPEIQLTRLAKEAGVALLGALGVKGTKKELESLVEEVKGHALTVSLLGAYLHDAHGGDVRKRDLVKLDSADREEQGGHAFRVMEAYERWLESEGEKGQRALALLRLLGLFDRPATASCLGALLEAPAIPQLTQALVGLGEAERNVTLSRLEAAKLLTVNRDASGTLVSLDAHPLLREYFDHEFRARHLEDWRAAHRRLYEHLCTTTPDVPRPTLEDLEPLYQAVAHGCQAGLHQEAYDRVYRDRIVRRQEFYSTHKLGAFGSDLGAVACFFESPWCRVSTALTEADQAWLLNAAAFRLRALGRLSEALEPMRAGLGMQLARLDWNNAARSASNLSELELSLGEVASALEDAGQSVAYADRCSDPAQRMSKRTTHADALHHAGRSVEAEVLFREAEALQAESQSNFPFLYSVQGFRYCDLLLVAPERAAWQRMLQVSDSLQPSSAMDACRLVAARAAQALKVATANNWLLDIALDHLTLGRAALYQAVLEGLDFETCRAFLEHAVDGLRRAGAQVFLPHGLLTRAWRRALTGSSTGPNSAQEDLDEAREIAERGPMPLFLADVHLHRARLFRDRAALAEARKLIEKHGYGRRKEELKDAEAAAAQWPVSERPQTTKGSPLMTPTPSSDRRRVFVSHASQDKPFVRRLVDELSRQDLHVWFDERELGVGDSIVQGISTGLKEADYLLVVLSKSSVQSRWVQNELNAALMEDTSKKCITVLPAVIDDCEIPILLRDRIYADFRQSFEHGIDGLTRVFEHEVNSAADLLPSVRSITGGGGEPSPCHTTLGALKLAELRRRITMRLSRTEVGTLWWDVLEKRMEDDMANRTLVECVIELLERSRSRNLLAEVIQGLCAERSDLAKA